MADETTVCSDKQEESFQLAWPRLILFGSSTTQFSFGRDGPWGAMLAHKLQRKCDVVTRGFSGYNSRWARLILPRILTASNVHDVAGFVMSLGGNDCSVPEDLRHHVPLQEYTQNMSAMVEYLRSIGLDKKKIILFGCQAIDEEAWGLTCRHLGWTNYKKNQLAKLYSEACKSVAEKHEVDFVDLHTAMMAHGDLKSLLSDGLHFRVKGAELLVKLLLPLIEKRTSHLPHILPGYMQIDCGNPRKSLLPIGVIGLDPEKDGSWQFSSVADQVRLFGEHHSAKTLRREVVSYMARNRKQFALFVQGN